MTMHSHVSRGEKHYAAKLTADDVRLIRAAVVERRRLLKEAHQLSNKLLGEKLGVGKRTVEKVVTGETWQHI